MCLSIVHLANQCVLVFENGAVYTPQACNMLCNGERGLSIMLICLHKAKLVFCTYQGCVLQSLQPYQLIVLQQLEQQLQEQQGEQASQQATEAQKLKQQAVGRRCSTSATNQTNTSTDLPDQDNSVAEGAAGLLAMTSTADRTQATQVSRSCLHCSSSCTCPKGFLFLWASVNCCRHEVSRSLSQSQPVAHS